MPISQDTRTERDRAVAILAECARNNFTQRDVEVAAVFIRRGLPAGGFKVPTSLTALAEALHAPGDE